MSRAFTESIVEDAALAWLASLGYAVLHGPHERSEERQGYRNGTRVRTLYTRVGPVSLQVPQARDGSFATAICKRYQRAEQALVLALMARVVNGSPRARLRILRRSGAGRASPRRR